MKRLAVNTYIERFKYLILSLIFLVSGVMIETNILFRSFNQRSAEKFQDIIYKKEELAKQLEVKIADLLRATPDISKRELYEFTYSHKRFLEDRSISFVIFKNDTSFFWTNNNFYLEKNFTQNSFTFPTFKIDHNFFISSLSELNEYKIVILSLIKHEYSYENKFLTSNFQHDFNISKHIQISTTDTTGVYKIYSSKGNILFNLTNTKHSAKNTTQRNTAIVLYFLGIIFLLFFLHNFLLKFRRKKWVDLFNLAFLIAIIPIRYWMTTQKIPYVAYSTDFFSPQYFGVSSFIPSLGDLVINIFLLLYFVVEINQRLKSGLVFRVGKVYKYITLIVTPIFLGAFFYFACFIIKTLILNSNIQFETNKILDLNFLSIAGYIVILLSFYCYTILTNGFFLALPRNVEHREFVKFSVPSFLAGLIILLILKHNYVGILIATIHFFVFTIFSYTRYYKNQKLSFSIKFLLIVLFSLFSQQLIYEYSRLKDNEIKKLYALNLSNEQDPVAELLLSEIENTMKKDFFLDSLIKNPVENEEKIHRYITKKYFNGFFKKYNLETTVCGNSSIFQSQNQIFNCDNYFNQTLNKFGLRLRNSNYYYLNDRNGNISYFGSITFSKDSMMTKLYMKLNSKLINEDLGYPELLLEGNYIQNKLFNKYSYAFYKNNRLVSRKGTFAYNMSYPFPVHDISSEFEYHSKDFYNHVVYNLDKTTSIIISSPDSGVFDHLISVAYLALIFFIILMFTEFINSIHRGTWRITITFRHKIQFVIIGLLVTSMLLIGTIVIVLNIKQFKDTQYQLLDDKLQSVLSELEGRFAQFNSINEISDERLIYRLIDYSNIYFADLNIYTLDGFLRASSRSEIFEYGLCGKQMDMKAFERIGISELPKFVHQENIGSMNFISAYAVIKNKNNMPLAILNLPYFSKQEVFSEQISSVIISILNIFVILIVISTIIAVFVANLVTKPLNMLKDKMMKLDLHGQNEKIFWSSEDEIGSLINNYNFMVDELEQSARRLSESEREGAWREMARQIAHEIKNPLTPMKLNIQLLNKSWKNKDKDFDERLRNISGSLIEQIDALAQTATEFSNFARINEINFEKTNLILTLTSCINLFENTDNIVFECNFSEEEELYVLADKEKLLRAFNNIVKNAIQAISFKDSGVIRIEVFDLKGQIQIKISDNGSGIPPELHKRLFEPNFTTKTSGSGLGLPITKNIIERMNGNIYFTTELGEGTSFIIELPKIAEE